MGYLFWKPTAEFDLHIKMINRPYDTIVEVLLVENLGFQKNKTNTEFLNLFIAFV